MPKTYNDYYIETRRVLRQAGVEGATLEARLLTAFAAEKTTEEFIRDLRLYTNDGFESRIFEYIDRRLAGEPVAYITGCWEFYGLPILVSPEVLIPRTDTELLAKTAIDSFSGKLIQARILDLCCGSGCVGCAIASKLQSSRVVLADVSPSAVDISRKNASLNRLSARVNCVEADVNSAPPIMLGTFDLVVSNPPYIPSADINTLDPSVRDYEPRLALDGGADGLDFYRAILRNWKPAVRDGGYMLFEVGIAQAEAVKMLMLMAGFTGVDGILDTGGIERVVYGKL